MSVSLFVFQSVNFALIEMLTHLKIIHVMQRPVPAISPIHLIPAHTYTLVPSLPDYSCWKIPQIPSSGIAVPRCLGRVGCLFEGDLLPRENLKSGTEIRTCPDFKFCNKKIEIRTCPELISRRVRILNFAIEKIKYGRVRN